MVMMFSTSIDVKKWFQNLWIRLLLFLIINLFVRFCTTIVCRKFSRLVSLSVYSILLDIKIYNPMTKDPINYYITATSASSIVRLNATGCGKARTYGHVKIIEILPTIFNKASNCTTPYSELDKVFKVKIPRSWTEWVSGIREIL